ncbi:MAG: septal ring lytic transglycosylase RlpA family protein [Verrucomicrobiota bacterium]
MNRTLPLIVLTTMGVMLPGLTPLEATTRNPVDSNISSKAGRPSGEESKSSSAQKSRPPSRTQRTTASSRPSGRSYTGKASFYGGKWHGRKTANGEIYNQNSMTAAHKTLPFNTRVRVTNLNNDRSVVLRINNRGPYIAGRIIDVSVAAARQLQMVNAGVVPVRVEVL